MTPHASPKDGRALRVLMIDNYDSFTYNIVQYLGELGAQVARRRRKLRRMLLLASGEAGVNSRKRLSVVFQQLLLARGRRGLVVIDDLRVAFS